MLDDKVHQGFDKRLSCEECHKTFSLKASLTKHMREIHVGEQNFSLFVRLQAWMHGYLLFTYLLTQTLPIIQGVLGKIFVSVEKLITLL